MVVAIRPGVDVVADVSKMSSSNTRKGDSAFQQSSEKKREFSIARLYQPVIIA